MNPYENFKFKPSFNRDWVNGFEAENVEKPDYVKILTPTAEEKAAAVQKYSAIYAKALDDFKNKTSLTSWDMDILMVAAALQTLRWAFISNDVGRFDKASDADKAFKNVKTSFRPYCAL